MALMMVRILRATAMRADHLWLPAGEQTLVKQLEIGIAATGGERCHVEGAAQDRAAAADHALALPAAGLTRVRSQASEAGDAAPIEAPELRDFRQEGARQYVFHARKGDQK